ncbi:MAG: DUF4339 domain-containing protein [Prosthecobacter sp.]|nr:DUF4339 domain-containing protein [Prosthecobacter sp.]
MGAHFYISKNHKTLGPCTLDDLRSFVAYGSVEGNDLVKREGESDWTPLGQLQELCPDDPDALTPYEIATRRRSARYRKYAKVPDRSRSGWVLARLVAGFLLFPPLLWLGAMAIYQGRIYTRKKDAHGYLRTWPRSVEISVSIMLVINAIAWWWGLSWLSHEAEPLARELVSMSRTAITDLQDWLGRR